MPIRSTKSVKWKAIILINMRKQNCKLEWARKYEKKNKTLTVLKLLIQARYEFASGY